MKRTVNVIILSFLFCSCHSQQHSPKKEIKNNGFQFNTVSQSAKERYAEAIQPLYQQMLLNKGFNGSVLLAKDGEIVFEDYHGVYDTRTKENISSTTPFQIASISKTFTGMTVLKLWEEGRISLDDSVQHFIPKFPYHNITIRELLSHQSGLPKYEHFMDGSKTETYYTKNKRGKLIKHTRVIKNKNAPVINGLITNDVMLQYMIDNKPPVQFAPNRMFNYCNTNFAILAIIVEKITKIPFPQYMKDSVFTPLGMKNTFIFSSADIANYVPSYNYRKVPYMLEKFDYIYGDKNVYSTVRDMLLWDKALYTGTFVKQSTVEMAAHPQTFERKKGHYYGLGWHLQITDNNLDTVIYHNGWWHGNNTVFTRLVSDTATLIILGNKFNKSIYKARQLINVFSTIENDSTDIEE
ncbi:MAG: beta-lactamase family protein [Bacteroidota bacterium]|nr:beta-lactamase family protein [Bacteroidota bacterium]